MAVKKKLNPTSIQTNKLIAELPEKRERIKAQIGFRNNMLEPQKIINHKNEFDRLQGAKKTARVGCQYKNKNTRSAKEGKAITKWFTTSS